jgi:Ribbon-helix-helix protein, copG family
MMPRTSSEPNAEIITFRIPSALKTALSEIAAEEEKPIGEVLRDLIRQKVKEKERQLFEAEARRQSLLLAEAAKDSNGDEAQIMRELDANFDEFARELAAQEDATERRSRKSK